MAKKKLNPFSKKENKESVRVNETANKPIITYPYDNNFVLKLTFKEREANLKETDIIIHNGSIKKGTFFTEDGGITYELEVLPNAKETVEVILIKETSELSTEIIAKEKEPSDKETNSENRVKNNRLARVKRLR